MCFSSLQLVFLTNDYVVWPVGVSSSSPLNPFDILPVAGARSFAFWCDMIVKAHLVKFLPQTWNQPFL